MSSQQETHTGTAFAEETHVIMQRHPPLEGLHISERFRLLAKECDSIEYDVQQLLADGVDPAFILEFLTKHLRVIHEDAKQLIAMCCGKSPITHEENPSHPHPRLDATLKQLLLHRSALLRWAQHTSDSFCLEAPTGWRMETDASQKASLALSL